MIIPNGYTEEEVLAIINKVTSSLARKYKFGYHELEDMKQQGIIIAIEGLERYDGVRPLENFLWVHVHNRLYNFKRNNFGRPDKPCLNCPLQAYKNNMCTLYKNEMECEIYEKWYQKNDIKRALMSSRDSEDTFAETSPIEDELFKKEIFNIIDKQIPINMREDWIRFCNKLKLSKIRRTALIEQILLILKEKGIDHEYE